MDLSGPLPSGSIEKKPEALPVSRWASQEGSKMAEQKNSNKNLQSGHVEHHQRRKTVYLAL